MNKSAIAKLRHLHEIDEAHGVDWWRDVPAADRLHVYELIQATGGTPEKELISRFAQIGFTHIALLAQGKEPPCNTDPQNS